MPQRSFFTSFLLPVAAATAISATFGACRPPVAAEIGDTRQQRRHGLTPDDRQQRHTGPTVIGRASESGRGREADQPHQIPARGWWDILVRVKNEMSKDNLSVLVAAVAFYSLLAIFPALAAAVSIYGMAFDPHGVEQQISMAIALIPEEARAIITDQLSKITSQPRQSLGFGALLLVLSR